MIQIDIYNVLSGNSAVTNLVSTRIYPIELPQKSPVPAIVYVVNDITPVKSLAGESGLDNAIVEITCWARSYLVAHAIASAVRSAFVESGLGVLTEDMQDMRDEETRNHGVVMRMSVWSESNISQVIPSFNTAGTVGQTVFSGDNSTTEFTLPKFQAGSLLVFINGRLAKKGEQSDATGAYYEKSTHDGFVFRTAPKGGDYADELLAFYAKAA